jgi:hypothetical protein
VDDGLPAGDGALAPAPPGRVDVVEEAEDAAGSGALLAVAGPPDDDGPDLERVGFLVDHDVGLPAEDVAQGGEELDQDGVGVALGRRLDGRDHLPDDPDARRPAHRPGPGPVRERPRHDGLEARQGPYARFHLRDGRSTLTHGSSCSSSSLPLRRPRLAIVLAIPDGPLPWQNMK